MLRFQTAVNVKRPVDEVFAYLSDLDKQAEWSSAVQEVQRDGFGPVAQGTRYRTRIKMMGRAFDGLNEISDYQPNRRIEFTTLSGPMPYRWDVELAGSDGATALTSHTQAEPAGVFKFAAGMIRGAMQRQAQNDFLTLKAILPVSDQ